MKVAVITPTVGSAYLADCIDSIQDQTHLDVEHYIFVDGKENNSKVDNILSLTKSNKSINVNRIAKNVGKNGWYGHRVYAACSFLVDADIICYLDEDNWFEADHIQSLVDTITEHDLDWAYSLRKIVDVNGKYICNDDCESLGQWPAYVNDQALHIDTSCYAIKRDIALTLGHAWFAQWGADRRFFLALRNYFQNYGCSKKYSCCYRLEGNQGSVTNDFFMKGNAIMKERYPEGFPWALEVQAQR